MLTGVHTYTYVRKYIVFSVDILLPCICILFSEELPGERNVEEEMEFNWIQVSRL